MIPEIIGAVLLAMLILLGLGLVVFGLPGTFIILLGAVIYDVVTWSWDISGTTLLILLGIAVLGEIFDVIASGIAVKKSGSSFIGVLGAVIGGIIGGIIGVPIPILGSVIGVFIGAFLGAFTFELLHYRNFKKAWHAGAAAFVGRLVSIFFKLALSVIMIIMIGWTIIA